MDNSREIYSLHRRANKIGLVKAPPKFSVAVWNEGEEPPAEEPWQLRIMIEKKAP
jgi:hypothetical protein